MAKENAGKDERYGFDAALGSHYTFQCGLKMSHSVSFGFTRDKQIEIREAPGTKNNPRKRQTGQPSGRTWGYKAAGLFKDQADIDNWAYQKGVMPGDIKYVDINGDGKIDSEDQVIIGFNQTPEVMWGYNLRLEYKNFDFSMFIQGAAFEGGHIIHGAANAMYLPKVIKFNAKDETAAKRYAFIADFLHLGGNTQDEKIDNLIAMLRKMNDDLNIPHCIKNYGEGGLPAETGFVSEEEFKAKLHDIAANAILDACTGSNPRQPSQEEMEKLLTCCYYDTEVDF